MTTQCLLDAKEALETLDLAKISRIYATDFIFEDIPGREVINDQAALHGYFSRLFALPGVAFSDIRIFDGGTFAALEWT